MSNCIGCPDDSGQWKDCTSPATQGDVYCAPCREWIEMHPPERVS